MFSCAKVVFVCLAVLAMNARAFDITERKFEINFTDKDIVPQEQLTPTLRDAKKEYKFIGDLVIGEHHADETVFRRSVEVSNPTDQVYSSTITLNVERGTIHYISVTNEKNSYAVACDEPYSLGGSKTSFNVRVPPSTKSYLWLVVAAH